MRGVALSLLGALSETGASEARVPLAPTLAIAGPAGAGYRETDSKHARSPRWGGDESIAAVGQRAVE